jgi:hypothetical protein
MKRDKLAEWLKRQTGGAYTLVWYSPGDGVTRYKIAEGNEGNVDYFARHGEVRCLGLHDAELMVSAFIEGWNCGRA